VIKSLQRSAWTVPVVSHWGISGRAPFPELAGSWAGKVHFRADLQLLRQSERGRQGACLAALMAKYPDIKGPRRRHGRRSASPNAYDAMQLTALALNKAGVNRRREAARRFFLGIDSYQGPDQELHKTLHRRQP